MEKQNEQKIIKNQVTGFYYENDALRLQRERLLEEHLNGKSSGQ